MKAIVKKLNSRGGYVYLPKAYIGKEVEILLPNVLTQEVVLTQDRAPMPKEIPELLQLRPTPAELPRPQEAAQIEQIKQALPIGPNLQILRLAGQESDRRAFLEGWKKLKGNPLKEHMRDWRNKAGYEIVDKWQMEG